MAWNRTVPTLVILIASVVCTQAWGGYSDVVLADNPVAYYRLDELVGPTGANQGSLGSAADGTYADSMTWDGTGLITDDTNKAVLFQGGRVDIPIVDGINQGGPFAQKTIELWFKPTIVSGRQVLYEQGSSDRGLNIYLDNDTLYIVGYNRTGLAPTQWGASTPLFVASSTTIQADETYYVALVLDGNSSETGSLTGYLDGVSFGQVSGAGKLYDDAAAVIGAVEVQTRFHDNETVISGDAFAGVIDEVAHYNTALSAEQIQAHYDAGTSPGSAPNSVKIIKWIEIP